MNYTSMLAVVTHPLTALSGIAFIALLSGIFLMKFAKRQGKDSLIDVASILQGGGGSVFLGITLTAWMAANNMVS